MTASAPITRLIAELSDNDECVRACAAFNLGSTGEETAVPALMELLRSKNALDRRVAAFALGKIGAPDAIPALLAVLKKDRDAGVAKFASEAIESISPSAVSRAA